MAKKGKMKKARRLAKQLREQEAGEARQRRFGEG
jgi:hypothetical protein